VRTDARGTGESTQGSWDFFGPGEQRDLCDSIEWAAAQPWSNRHVGMLGQSYFAQVQWLAAVNQPPSLKCIAPYDGLVDIYRDLAWHGGIFSQEFVTGWAARQIHLNHLPFEPAPPTNVMSFDVTGELIRQRLDGPFYQHRSAFWRLKQIRVPVYSIGAWEKVRLHTRGNLLGFEHVPQVPRKLLMLGGDAQATFHTEPLMRELKRWYDRWLKGIDNGIEREPPVRLYVQGKNPGFRCEQEWPLARRRDLADIMALRARQPHRARNREWRPQPFLRLQGRTRQLPLRRPPSLAPSTAGDPPVMTHPRAGLAPGSNRNALSASGS